MKRISARFVISLVAYSSVITALGIVLKWYRPNYINQYFFYIQYVFVLLTIASFTLLNNNPKQDGFDYINKFFAAKGLKIIFSAIIIILYINMVSEDKISFIFNLFAIYLLYTAFEIKMLLANLRAQI